jgi:hypothetical protein
MSTSGRTNRATTGENEGERGSHCLRIWTNDGHEQDMCSHVTNLDNLDDISAELDPIGDIQWRLAVVLSSKVNK